MMARATPACAPCWSPTLKLPSASKPSNHQRMDSLEEQLRTLRN
jgi:hypothetical protein